MLLLWLQVLAPARAFDRSGEPLAGILTDEEVRRLVRSATRLLDMEAQGEGAADARQGALIVYQSLFTSGWSVSGAETWQLIRGLQSRILLMAGEGDLEAAIALQASALGPYARTPEGRRSFGEDLWGLLEARPDLSLDALATQSDQARGDLMRLHYSAPPHDLFDFAAIVDGLDGASIPVSVKEEARAIRSSAWQTVELLGGTREAFMEWQAGLRAQGPGTAGGREAARRYEKAAELAPNWPEPHRRLGDIYAAMGRREDAARHLRRVLELDPRLPSDERQKIQSRIEKLQE